MLWGRLLAEVSVPEEGPVHRERVPTQVQVCFGDCWGLMPLPPCVQLSTAGYRLVITVILEGLGGTPVPAGCLVEVLPWATHHPENTHTERGEGTRPAWCSGLWGHKLTCLSAKAGGVMPGMV